MVEHTMSGQTAIFCDVGRISAAFGDTKNAHRAQRQRHSEMAVKLLSDSHDATITDDDQIRIDAILTFWFMEKELSAPQIDGRMDLWFGDDQVFDQDIVKEFSDDVERASDE